MTTETNFAFIVKENKNPDAAIVAHMRVSESDAQAMYVERLSQHATVSKGEAEVRAKVAFAELNNDAYMVGFTDVTGNELYFTNDPDLYLN